MAISQYDYTKLLHSIKLISKAIKVVADENDGNKRQYAKELASDIVDLMFRELNEMKEGFIPIEHDGHIE